MYCNKCGSWVDENQRFCNKCGSNQGSSYVTNNNGIRCPHCGSENVNIQIINEQKLVTKHHGILWWVCIGWWWIPVKWIFLTIPALLAAIFIGKRKKIKNITKTKHVCQNCGKVW